MTVVNVLVDCRVVAANLAVDVHCLIRYFRVKDLHAARRPPGRTDNGTLFRVTSAKKQQVHFLNIYSTSRLCSYVAGRQ